MAYLVLFDVGRVVGGGGVELEEPHVLHGRPRLRRHLRNYTLPLRLGLHRPARQNGPSVAGRKQTDGVATTIPLRF